MSISNQLWPDVRERSLRTRRHGIILVSAWLVCLAVLPAAAQAGYGAGTSVTFPTAVTVGDTGSPASITIENRNTAPNTGDTNRICNGPDTAAGCTGRGDSGILLVPACMQVSAGACTTVGADPGVFRVSPAGTGRSGTACAGTSFSTSIVTPSFGTVRFTPQPAGTHVTLPGFGSDCVIDFTFDVLKSPSADQDPSTPGNQTAQATEHTQFSGSLNAFAAGTSNGTTVRRAGPPSITTAASADIALGGELSDEATVSGLVNPVPGGSVTFRLYPPSAPACTGAPVFSDTQVVALAGTTATATSGTFTPTVAGVYRWVATYDGDANNMPVSGVCGEASETTTVTGPPPPPQPPTPPTPPASGVLGECIEAPGPAPAGSVLCRRGNALLSGRTGCQRKAFRVQVRGEQIAKVVFTVDGAKLATLRAPNSGNRFSVMLVPRNLEIGRHRVNARITFAKSSGTRARTLGMVVSRCRRAAVQPRFVG